MRAREMFISTDFRVVLRDVAADEGPQVPGVGLGGRAGAGDLLSGSWGLHRTPQRLPARLGEGRRAAELLLCRDA